MKRLLLALLVLIFIPQVAVHGQTGSVWSCDFRQFSTDIQTYFEVVNDGELDVDMNDYELGAFVGNQCRGVAARAVQSGGKQLFLMRVWTNNTQEQFTLKLYSRRSGQVYGVAGNPAYSFSGSDFIGSLSNPEQLHVNIGLDDNPNLPSIDGSLWSCYYTKFSVDVQTYFEVVNDGDLDIDMGDCELGAFVGEDCRGVAAYAVPSGSKQLFMMRVWTNKPQEQFSLKLYSRRTGKIYELTGNPVYSLSGSDFIGSISNPELLHVNIGFDDNPNLPSIGGSIWSCHYTKFSSDIQTYFEVVNDGELDVNVNDYELGAFVGDECRGVVTRPTKSGTKSVFMMRVWTNDSQEQFTLKLYDRRNGRICEIVGNPAYSFSGSDFVGSINKPEQLHVNIGLDDSPNLPSIGGSIWTCYYTKYDKDIPMYLTVNGAKNGRPIPQMENYELGAFVGEECRGVAVGTINNGSKNLYSIRVYGDLDNVSFKLYDKVNATEYPLYYASLNVEDQKVGSLFNPAELLSDDLWEKPYTITWTNSVTGDSLVQDCYVGDSILAPVMEAEGHTFVGWNQSIPAIMPAMNLQFIAQFKVNTYMMTFLDYDDSVIKTDSVEYNAPVVCPENPVRTGYTFTGWDTEVPQLMPAHDVTVKAQYVVNRHRLVFYDSDETVLADDSVAYGSPVVAPEVQSKDGHPFKCWDKTVPEVMPDSDLVFHAIYNVRYTITYKDYDGSVLKCDTLSLGAAIVRPQDPVRTGYTFTGWTPEIPETMPSRNLTVKAEYIVNLYAVVFKAGDVEIRRDSLEYGSYITYAPSEEEVPSVPGMNFSGWEPVLVLGQTKVEDHDMTFTAVYVEGEPHTLTYLLNGEEYFTAKLAYHDPLPEVAAPEAEGHTFSGWQGLPEDGLMPDADLTVTGTLTANMYHVVFYDGEDILSEATLAFGDSIKVPSVAKEGHTFMGWDKPVVAIMPACDLEYRASYRKNVYNIVFSVDDVEYRRVPVEYQASVPDTTFVMSTVGYDYTPWVWSEQPELMPAHNIAVTCSRTVHTWTLVFDVNGKRTETQLDYASVIPHPEDPVLEGHTFAGWVPEIAPVMPDSNVVYVATFTANDYVVNFLDYNGKTIQSMTLPYGSAITAPQVPEREGYSFKEWAPELLETVPARNVTYTATYVINKYNVSFLDKDGELLVSYKLDYGSTINANVHAPEIDDMTFSGWDPDFISGVTTVPSYDTEFRAVYKVNPHKLTYMVDGELYYEKVLCAGDVITEITDPLKTGYTFAGWTGLPQDMLMPAMDLVVSGTFDANKHTVTYIVGDEQIVDTLEFGQAIVAPIPERLGHTFVGWNVVLEQEMPDYDLEYIAVFARNKYSATFYDYDGVTVLNRQIIDFGDPISVPADPTRLGYTFTGWNREIAENMGAANETYVATYDINLYSLTYYVDDEEVSIKQYVYGRSLTVMPNPTRQGYEFSGWTYDNPSDQEAHEFPVTMPLHDVIIKGYFTEKTTFGSDELTFSITDHESGVCEVVGLDNKPLESSPRRFASGQNNLVIPASVTDELGHQYTVLSIASKAFEGSRFESISIPETVTKLDGDALAGCDRLKEVVFTGDILPTLEANAFDLENVTIAMTSENVSEEQKNLLIDNAKAELAEANEEAAAQEAAAQESDDSMVSQIFNVTAAANREVEIEGVGEYRYGQTVILTAPVLTGCTMAWYENDADGQLLSTDNYLVCPETQDLRVYVKYSNQIYNLTLIADNDTLAVLGVEYGEKPTNLPEPDKREGYTFGGWNGVPEMMPAYDVVVNGKFKINSHFVTFVADDEVLARVKLNYGEDITLPEVNRTGYTLNWESTAPTTVPDMDIEIHGFYEANIYNVTYHYGDSIVNVQEVAFGQEIPTYTFVPENTEECSYTFVGWKDEMGNPVSLTIMPARDIDVWADIQIVDSIGVIAIDQQTNQPVVTDLGGRVVRKPANGIYIVDGKKVLLK